MNTYYVSVNGNDAVATTDKSAGTTEDRAFKTIGKAVSRITPGDTVLIMDGVYERGFTIQGINGSSDAWTTIKPYPGHSPKIKTKSSAINIFGSSYIRIEGLNLEGGNKDLTIEYALKEKDNLSNPLTYANGITIQIRNKINPHHIVISGNTVRDFPGGGIAFSDSDYLLVKNNIVSGCALYSPYGNQGITTLRGFNFDDNQDDYRIVYRGNTVYDCQSLVPWKQAGKITEGHGIMLDTTKYPYTGKALIENNIAYNNGGSGIFIFEANNVDVVNNTCFQNASYHKNHGEISVTYSQNVKVFNNIMYARAGRNANLVGGNTAKNIVYSQNLVYNHTVFIDSVNPKLSSLQNMIGKDPLFVNADIKDFSLKTESPAIIKEVIQTVINHPIGYQGNYRKLE